MRPTVPLITFVSLSSATSFHAVDYEDAIEHHARQSHHKGYSAEFNEYLSQHDLMASDAHANPEEGLNLFVGLLKSYVSDTTFKVAEFGDVVGTLENELFVLDNWVSRSTPSRDVSAQLRFVKRMFHVFQVSTQLLNHFSSIDVPGNRLLYKIIELSVRIMALHNTHGSLDLRTHKNEEKLVFLTDCLYNWGERFHNLPGVPEEMRSEFRVQFNQAENLLIYLRSFVPRQKYK